MYTATEVGAPSVESIADVYSEDEHYQLNSFVYHEGKLYSCIMAPGVDVTGEWDESKWEEVSIITLAKFLLEGMNTASDKANNAVSYNEDQLLTDTQQAQARENISAASQAAIAQEFSEDTAYIHDMCVWHDGKLYVCIA